jgi:hypothetical protein
MIPVRWIARQTINVLCAGIVVPGSGVNTNLLAVTSRMSVTTDYTATAMRHVTVLDHVKAEATHVLEMHVTKRMTNVYQIAVRMKTVLLAGNA